MKHINSLSTTVSHLPGPQRLIRIHEMMALLNCSRTTLYRWANSGEFPAPKKRAGRTMGWTVTQYEQWLDNCCQICKKGWDFQPFFLSADATV